ncbi:hypothetical protein ScPMuIL_008958 [Solemya velum]
MPQIKEITSDPQTLKDDGNNFFKAGKFMEALSSYTEALEFSDTCLKDTEKAVIYKNRAACYLKLEQYQNAVDDATAALDITPNDPKALFRRCQAKEQLGEVVEAYKDAALLLKVDPKNGAIQPILKRLNPVIHDKVKQENSLASRLSQMGDLAFEPTEDAEKRLQAINNLIVLAREEAGAHKICQEETLHQLTKLLDDKNNDLVLASVRVLSCVTNKSKARCGTVYNELGAAKLCQLLGGPKEDVCVAVSHLLQNLITYMGELDIQKEKLEKHEEARRKGDKTRYPQYTIPEDALVLVEAVFPMLIKMLQSPKYSSYGRDCMMELLMKNVPRKEGLGWVKPFLQSEGIEGLLVVAGAIKHSNSLPITENSKMHASVTLSRIYDDLLSDKERDLFKEKCSAFFKDLFGDEIFESKVEAIKAVSTLLQGPFEVGNMIMGFEGVSQVMMALANSANSEHQKIAVEAIIHSASKKDRCSGMLADAVPVLKKLYNSQNDHIKVRGLVGLCKLGSFGGTDASNKPMADGSTLLLAKACRKFLTNPTKDIDLRRWATEGLAYLTLDAEVKEELVEDKEALRSLIDVVKKFDKNLLYAACAVFVNLTNSYDKQEMVPEMVELAKFAKQHVPEEHEKDSPEFLRKRIKALAEANIVTALVALSSTDSLGSRDLLARVYLALATDEELRGLIVQQGGAKALISLALKNTEHGKCLAGQALAKIAITMNPEVAFPGQRMYEVVRPLIHLLHIDMTGLQNFEALMALTNLASMSEQVRKRIVSERGLPCIEHWMFEEHELIKRAATECMCNMVISEDVRKLFEGENDRVKLFLLYCQDEDPLIVRAAAGGLAMLASSPKICQKILDVKPWNDVLMGLLVNEDKDIQHRGCSLVQTMVSASKDIAEKIVEGQILEILMAVSILEAPERQNARNCCKATLEQAMEYGLIKPTTDTS